MNRHIVVLAVILMLSPLVISTYASDLSLTNAIMIHSFDTLYGSSFESTGVLILSNKGNASVTVSFYVEKELRQTDLELGEPRKHNVISNVIYFHQLPADSDWVDIETETVTVPAGQSAKINYTINIPKEELPKYIDRKNGFLFYISVDGESEEGGGNKVNIGYLYKVFVMFPIVEPSILTNPLLILTLSVLVTLITYITIIIIKKIRLNKKEQIVDD